METEGIIQAIRNNQKGVKVNDEWYSSFKVMNDFETGDFVKIAYKEKDQFKNISSIIRLDKETKDLKKVNDTTINTILMITKDIYLGSDNKESLDKITDLVLKSYKKIKENLQSPFITIQSDT